MDKYEYKLKLDQMKSLSAAQNYEAAAEIADSINWPKMKNVNALMKAGEIYEKVGRYEESREVLLMAYERSPIGRMIIYRLAEVAIKMGNYEEAKNYYQEFVEIAPHDNIKYVLKYEISKAEGADLGTLISILEELKEQEYSEEWAYELAYLYHRAGMSEKCIDACDELILWFGDGPYVERALELKMLYQPLTKQQEEKYRQLKQGGDGMVQVLPEDELDSGEIVSAPVQIPKVKIPPERFNTQNLQEELQKSVQQIMNATEKEAVEDGMDTIKKLVEDIPYLQIPKEETAKLPHIETDAEIDDSLKNNFKELLAEDKGAQAAEPAPEYGGEEPPSDGQMSIDDVLSDWERTRRAAETALQEAEQRKLNSAKARALQEAGDIMDRLVDAIPKLDSGASPRDLLVEQYLGGQPVEEDRAVEMVMSMNQSMERELKRVAMENAKLDEQLVAARAGKWPGPQGPRGDAAWQRAAGEAVPAQGMNPGMGAFSAGATYAPEGTLEMEASSAGASHAEEDMPGMEELSAGALYEPEDAPGMGAFSAGGLYAAETWQRAAGEAVPAQGTNPGAMNPGMGASSAGTTYEPEGTPGMEELSAGALYAPEDAPGMGASSAGVSHTSEDMPGFGPGDMYELGYGAKPEGWSDPTAGAERWGTREPGGISHGLEPGDGRVAESDVGKDAMPEQGDGVREDSARGYHPQGMTDMGTGGLRERQWKTEDLPEIALPDDLAYLEKPAGQAKRRDAAIVGPQPEHSAPDMESVLLAEASRDPEEGTRAVHGDGLLPKKEAKKKDAASLPRIQEPEEIDIQPAVKQLTKEQKDIFTYFIPIKGMEQQICQALTGVSRHLMRDKTASTGNMIIQGTQGSGKTVLATGMIRAIKLETGKLNGTPGKIEGSVLNQKNFPSLLKKVAGGCLIIEKAGDITRDTAIKLSHLLGNDASGLLVIMEDTRRGIDRALGRDAGFAAKFTEKITIPIFNSDELVTFARSYANELGYTIDEMGVLALYNSISSIQKLDQATTLTEVKAIVDGAIAKVERGGLKKAFSILTSRRYDDEDYVILHEKDFAF